MRVPFDPPPGIVSDDTTFATGGLWADGDGARPWRGRMESIGGHSSALDDTLSGICRNYLSWINADSQLCIAFGTNTHLMVSVDGELFDITPVGLAIGAVDGTGGGRGYGAGEYGEGDYGEETAGEVYPRTWSLALYGGVLLANPRGGMIYRWDGVTTDPAVQLTGSPDNVMYVLVTAERQVIAIGTNEEVSGDFNPLCIRGSDIEDPEDWTTTATNNAFEHIIEGGGSRLVAGRIVGPYVMLWTDTALHQGQFIGDPGQTYRFDLVGSNAGLLGPNAACVADQNVVFLGPDLQFRQWAVGSVPSFIECPIRNDFKDNLAEGQGEKITAGLVSKFNEVWFHYPDSRDGNENSRYVAFSLQSGLWFRGRMARTAYGPAASTIIENATLGVDADGAVFYQETGYTANGGVLTGYLESADQYVDEGARYIQLSECYPDFEDQQGAVSLTIYYRKEPQATERTYGPKALVPGRGKRSILVSGRVMRVRLSWSSAPFRVRLGKMTFETQPVGTQ